jgi:hypothetical protein
VGLGFALGERPAMLAWLGVLVALPVTWLVARGFRLIVSRAWFGVGEALLAGLGSGLLFAALDRIPEDSGWLPLAFNEAVAGAMIAVVAALTGVQ